MFGSLTSRTRTVGVVGAGLAIAGAAVAHEAQAPTAQQAPAQAVSSVSAQIVVRDAATGELRAATPEEASALHSSRSGAVLRRGGAPGTQAKTHPSGARGARLTDEFMSYAVVVRQPDGSLASLCFATQEEADAALKGAPVAPVNKLPTE